MGWVWLALLGLAALGVLWLAGVPRGLSSFVASALMLGAAGYAWQGHATLGGHPVAFDSQPIPIEAGLVAFRSAIMPGRPGDDAILAAADDKLRAGDTEAAAQVLLDAIAANPDDGALWAGLGTAFAAHDGGQVSPSAQFAFRRAMSLDPNTPGPPFFLGLAYAQGGNAIGARLAWQRALALSPADAPWRPDIEDQLKMLDQFDAMNAGAPPDR